MPFAWAMRELDIKTQMVSTKIQVKDQTEKKITIVAVTEW